MTRIVGPESAGDEQSRVGQDKTTTGLCLNGSPLLQLKLDDTRRRVLEPARPTRYRLQQLRQPLGGRRQNPRVQASDTDTEEEADATAAVDTL